MRPVDMITPMTGTGIGKRIRLRRQALRLTQQQLADRIGVDRATVSAWERGRHLPERNEGAIEAALGITLEEDGGEPDYDEDDDIERTIWRDPLLASASVEMKRDLIRQLRAVRQDHIPRVNKPPA